MFFDFSVMKKLILLFGICLVLFTCGKGSDESALGALTKYFINTDEIKCLNLIIPCGLGVKIESRVERTHPEKSLHKFNAVINR